MNYLQLQLSKNKLESGNILFAIGCVTIGIAISIGFYLLNLKGAGYWICTVTLWLGILCSVYSTLAQCSVRPMVLFIALSITMMYIPRLFIVTGNPAKSVEGKVLDVDAYKGFLGINSKFRVDSSLGVFTTNQDIFNEGDIVILSHFTTEDGLATSSQLCSKRGKCESI